MKIKSSDVKYESELAILSRIMLVHFFAKLYGFVVGHDFAEIFWELDFYLSVMYLIVIHFVKESLNKKVYIFFLFVVYFNFLLIVTYDVMFNYIGNINGDDESTIESILKWFESGF